MGSITGTSAGNEITPPSERANTSDQAYLRYPSSLGKMQGNPEWGWKKDRGLDHVLIQRAVKDILPSEKMVALTGAGISVESGIPAIVEEVKRIRG